MEAVWPSRNGEAGADQGRRIGTHDRAEAIARKVSGQRAAITSHERVDRKQPPMLFKLNEFSSEASSLYGYPVDRTQRTAQSLHDRKLVTYPRTGSQHLRPEDNVEMVRDRLAQIAVVPGLSGPARAALARGVEPANKRIFDSNKVGDHFAIIPAELPGDLPALGEDEHKIYDLILRRFVAAFLAPSETIVHTLTFTVADETCVAVTRTILPSAEHPQIGVCHHCGGAVHEQPSRSTCVNATGANPPVWVCAQEAMVQPYRDESRGRAVDNQRPDKSAGRVSQQKEQAIQGNNYGRSGRQARV